MYLRHFQPINNEGVHLHIKWHKFKPVLRESFCILYLTSAFDRKPTFKEGYKVSWDIRRLSIERSYAFIYKTRQKKSETFKIKAPDIAVIEGVYFYNTLKMV